MEIEKIGRTLEVAREREVTININNTKYVLTCTPTNLDSLILGFLLTEGFINDVKDVKFEIDEDELKIDVKIHGRKKTRLRRIYTKRKYDVEELRTALTYLEIEEYKRTRGYHVACVVNEKGLVSRAYDVGRHNAVDKAIGMCLKKEIDFSEVFLLISGRISMNIALKCVRVGIPLIVSKAAIFDSAIELCRKTGLSAVSFATNIAVKGEALK